MPSRHDVEGIWRRLRALWGRGRRDRDVDDELAFHLAMRAAEHQRAGASTDDARRSAHRQFGNVAVIKEQTREMWTFPSFESFRQDVRYALRALRKSPGFSLTAILVLALGIGANTAMFSLVDAMLLRGLPYPDADRLVVLIGNVQRQTVERRGNSFPDHVDWRAKSTRFVDMAAYTTSTATLFGTDEPERVPVEAVSAPYFSLLGVAPLHGRTFRADEDQVAGRDAVVVLSHGLWTRRFAADPGIVDKPVQLGTRSFTVIGVMPAGFTGISDTAQLWLPFVMSGTSLDNRGNRGFQTLARLKPGESIDSARAELDVISRQLEAAYPATNDKRGVEVSPLAVEAFGQLEPVVLTLMGAVSFVLLIACANVANLLISRSEVRQTEIAVRTALGAGHGRLARQLITESCVLAIIAAVAGTAFALAAVRAVIAASPVAFPSFVQPGLSLPVLGVTIALALACGVLLGLAPAVHARVSRLTDALKSTARGSGGPRSQRLRGTLVVAEVALAIVLLVGAGLMIRSMQMLTAIDPGFDASGVLTFTVAVPRQPAAPPSAPPSSGPRPTSMPAGGPPAAPAPPPPPPPLVLSGRDLIERLRAVPGVSTVSLASDIPLGGGSSAVFYTAEGDTTANAQTMPRAYVHRVTANFFDTLRLPITTGRTFLDTEMTADSPAVIVSDGVAQRFWMGQDPIGKRIKIGPPTAPTPWLQVVGVVNSVRYRGLPENPTADPDLFFPAVDRSPQGVLLRTSVAPDTLERAVRSAIRAAHPSIVVYGVSPLDALVAAQTSASRFTTWLLGLFATTALVLSVIGIYGVMSYLVRQRTREFGIRLALGSSRTEIVRVVLRHGVRLVAAGAVLGLVGTFGLSRALGSLLYGVTPLDASAVVAVLVLVGVALAACVVPALRATRVNPVVALRNE